MFFKAKGFYNHNESFSWMRRGKLKNPLISNRIGSNVNKKFIKCTRWGRVGIGIKR